MHLEFRNLCLYLWKLIVLNWGFSLFVIFIFLLQKRLENVQNYFLINRLYKARNQRNFPHYWVYSNRFQYNRWQRRICTLSVQLYSYVTSVNLVFVSDKIIYNCDNLRIKCLFYSKISEAVCVLYFLFLHFF